MSLTHKEWEGIWESVGEIQRIANSLRKDNIIYSKRLETEVEYLKRRIQSVIGQME